MLRAVVVVFETSFFLLFEVSRALWSDETFWEDRSLERRDELEEAAAEEEEEEEETFFRHKFDKFGLHY